ncbi:MAG: bacillithiol biosynthesis deacetylase BshB1 [Saprospiraceae bacterium]|nr:MAG: bacillithiol biosynthesis deacetylase BshB1 [Saprospiraceae bacterium]
MKVDILAVGVHPDDIELSCVGTLLRHIDLGKTVGLLDLTQGEMGTRGNAQLRLREAEEAARLLGARFRLNLGMPDCFTSWSKENILAIVEVLRWCQPEIVLANAVQDRHPDHGRAAKIIADACFYSGLRKIETSREGNPQQAWRPRAVYHYIQDYNLKPDFCVDITPYMDRKIEIVRAFRSQFFLPADNEYSHEPPTPISGSEFIEFLRSKARTYGRPIGAEYAEGFTVNRTPGVTNLFDLR